MTLWREDRRPLAVQVRDLISTMLKDEKYGPGDRLPSEQELMARFSISRGALREALKLLEEERVVLCQHGVGRFVAPQPSGLFSDEITHLQSVTDLARSLGVTISTQVLSAREEPADEVCRKNLQLAEGQRVMILERVRCGAGEAIIYSIDIFRRELIGNQPLSMDFTGSLLALMEEGGHARLEYAKTTISAVQLEPALTQKIGAPTDVSWIMLEQVNYDSHHRPLLYSKDYHRGDKFQFRVLRRRR